ncbi:MAG: hypothetical protein ABIQ04_04985 [Candidatus Saccharimonadales bacterium]
MQRTMQTLLSKKIILIAGALVLVSFSATGTIVTLKSTQQRPLASTATPTEAPPVATTPIAPTYTDLTSDLNKIDASMQQDTNNMISADTSLNDQASTISE